MLRRELLMGAAALPVGVAAQRSLPASVGFRMPQGAGGYAALISQWAQIREQGYTGVEMPYASIEPHLERGGEVAAQLRRMGLRLYGIALGESAWASGLPARDTILRAAQAVGRVGGERVVLPVAGEGADALARATAMKALEAECRRMSIRVAYEAAPVEMPVMQKRAREVELVLGSMAAAEAAVLFKKHQGVLGAVVFGEGDLAPLAQAMFKSGWSGWVLSTGAAPREAIRRWIGV